MVPESGGLRLSPSRHIRDKPFREICPMKFSVKKMHVILSVAAVLCAAMPCRAATYHVRPDGDNANSGSAATPAEACAQRGPGTAGTPACGRQRGRHRDRALQGQPVPRERDLVGRKGAADHLHGTLRTESDRLPGRENGEKGKPGESAPTHRRRRRATRCSWPPASMPRRWPKSRRGPIPIRLRPWPLLPAERKESPSSSKDSPERSSTAAMRLSASHWRPHTSCSKALRCARRCLGQPRGQRRPPLLRDPRRKQGHQFSLRLERPDLRQHRL